MSNGSRNFLPVICGGQVRGPDRDSLQAANVKVTTPVTTAAQLRRKLQFTE
jgi:hypothetical protein